jgi:ferredoxin
VVRRNAESNSGISVNSRLQPGEEIPASMRTAQESVHFVAATIGFVSYAALWAGTLWGSVLRSGWATSRLRHQTVHGIHMHMILLGLTLGIAHGLVQAAAPYGKVRALDVVVPFGDRADPVGVGLGVLALELMVATALSVLVQRKLGYARWRALHSLGYLSFTMVAAHLLISGTEMYRAPARAVIAGSWAVVLVAGISTVAPVARMPRAILDRLTPRHRAEKVTVSVDPGKCGSFGFCEQEAPEIFTLRSDQRLAYRSVVASDQAEAAMRAAVVCPARAIKLGRLPATVVVSQPAADTATVAPLATTLTPHTAAHPAESAVDTGSFLRVATGPQPGLPAADTRSFRRARARPPAADTVSFPPGGRQGVEVNPHAGPHTGSLPAMATGRHTGPLPRVAGGPHTGPLPPVGSVPANGHHTGSVPVGSVPVGSVPVGSVPVGSVPVDGNTGRQPDLRPVADPAWSGIRAVDRRADPPPDGPPQDEPPQDGPLPDAPLPAPDQLQDTGRHHLPRLRGIPGGRS